MEAAGRRGRGASAELLTDAARDLPRGERLRLRVGADLACPRRRAPEFVARRLVSDADLGPPPLSSDGQGPREVLWQAVLQPTEEHDGEGSMVFALDVELPGCGQFRTEIRIYPWHELLSHPFELGLMKWL